MIVNIGPHLLVVENVVAIYETPETCQVCFVGGYTLNFSRSEVAELRAVLEITARDQQTLKTQIDAVNKQAADFAAKMEQLAAYEQQLMQKAAQVEAAHAALNNKVVGVGAMPAFGNGGRKRQ